MPLIAIATENSDYIGAYQDCIEKRGGQTVRMSLGVEKFVRKSIDGLQGLLVTGGSDLQSLFPVRVPELGSERIETPTSDRTALALLTEALKRDMPILALGKGMQVLNFLLGGGLLRNISGHALSGEIEDQNPMTHGIFLSPGTKSAAILGRGGFFKVNSRHRDGLRDMQRASSLLTSAYSFNDGIVEGIESPGHSWVIGLQCHPELEDEVPRSFNLLWEAFLERAEAFSV